MKLAFYAPLKPPGHPVPSGDRSMARAVVSALEHAGTDVVLASTLRSRDGAGYAALQTDLMENAEAELPGIINTGRRAGWQVWVTYHNYYKAPDLLGWRAAEALGIPYLLIEATRARKRLQGPWAQYAKAAEQACDKANVIFYLTSRDAEALHRDAPKDQHLIHLHPFLARAELPPAARADGSILSVGMMRSGDKLASYKIIAETLALLPANSWHLNIAGDGPARPDVERLMAPFGKSVTFLGQLTEAELAQVYQFAALLFWPGVNEAFGLSYLEAQAAGLPVVAQDRPGVRDVLAPRAHPAPEGGAGALATHLSALLSDADRRHAAGGAARNFVAKNHLLPAAATTLMQGLAAVGCAT